MKKLVTILLVLIYGFSHTHASVVNGTCGENLTWFLDTKDSTLTIEGSGAMNSYPSYRTPEWCEYAPYIKYLSLPEGLTNIGNYAFYKCSNLKTLTIPNNVTYIGSHAFYQCLSLKSLTIPNSVTYIGDWAFTSCQGLTSIEIPNGVKSIWERAFSGCVNLTSISIGKSVKSIGDNAFSSCGQLMSITSYAITPPSINGTVFDGVKISNCTLYVPAISMDTYKNTIIWEDFTNIEALPAQNPIVKFVDWDGTVLAADEVEEGSAATPPANPSREGYKFIGWDKDFSNVTEDLIVTALYEIIRYRVEFLDWDDTLLKVDSVDWNTNATFPENPHRNGYNFIGWDKPNEPVTSDLVIHAQYELGENTNIQITFKNGNSNENVLLYNAVLRVPDAPEIEDFTFLRWETIAGDIENGITIQAIYEPDDPSSTPDEVSVPGRHAQKLIRQGNVYILRDDRTYTLTGQELK